MPNGVAYIIFTPTHAVFLNTRHRNKQQKKLQYHSINVQPKILKRPQFQRRVIVMCLASIIAFNFLVILTSFIARFPSANTKCHCVGSFAISLESTFENYSLEGFVIKRSLVNSNEVNCFLACINDDCRCTSINFKIGPNEKGQHVCELNYETKDSEKAAFKKRIGWNHYQILIEVS